MAKNVCKKVLNITNYQGNENKNDEISPHNC